MRDGRQTQDIDDSSAVAVEPLEIRLLGDLQVTIGESVLNESAIRPRKVASLIKLLALTQGNRLHREQIMETLWPDLDPDAQANNFRVTLHQARRVLHPAGIQADSYLARDGDQIILAPADRIWVDVSAYEQFADAAWHGQDVSLHYRAIDLYRGDLLPQDLYDDWVDTHRTKLRSSYLALLRRVAALEEERGEPSQAVDALQRLVAAEPTHEAAARDLMRLLAESGRRSEALAAFERLRVALERDLDALPEPATEKLVASIRSGQIVGEADGHPPARSRVHAPHIPAQLTPLIGRWRELTEIQQLVVSARLVTLTGPGGIGKTRLALAVAENMVEEYADGSYVVNLAPVRDPHLVVSAIAQSLGVREASRHSLHQSVLSYLHDKHVLLVLDNFEQVLDAAPVVTDLLGHASNLDILVTSRARLNLRGEREYPVPPLDLPDRHQVSGTVSLSHYAATELFIERAREVRPDFRATDENEPAIAEICARLDGLPLAIELAAARCKILSPQAMLPRLDQRMRFLTGGARDLPERQQTIRSTIAWSYDLLEPEEQCLFRRLSVFIGGWDIEAAEAVASGDGEPSSPLQPLGVDMLNGLASLVDKSLVTQREWENGESRFGMLETIREFGLERLAASDEDDSVRDRHADWAIRLAEGAAPHLELRDQAVWLDRLQVEEGNLRAALDWLITRGRADQALRLVRALRLFWFMRGRLAEGVQHAIAAASLPENDADPVLRADALNAAGFLARQEGDLERAAGLIRESLALAQTLGDRKRIADGLANLGYVTLQQERYDEARELYAKSLSIYRESGNEQGIADSLSHLALVALNDNDLDTARSMNEESLAIWSRLGDREGVAWASARFGFVLLRQHAHNDAFEHLITGLTTSIELDYPWGIAWALEGFAHLAVAHHQPQLALRLVAASASIREQAGVPLPPVERQEVDTTIERARRAMRPDAAAAAWDEGTAWTPDRALYAVRNLLNSALSELA